MKKKKREKLRIAKNPERGGTCCCCGQQRDEDEVGRGLGGRASLRGMLAIEKGIDKSCLWKSQNDNKLGWRAWAWGAGMGMMDGKDFRGNGAFATAQGQESIIW